jgi:hypothetical protein
VVSASDAPPPTAGNCHARARATFVDTCSFGFGRETVRKCRACHAKARAALMDGCVCSLRRASPDCAKAPRLPRQSEGGPYGRLGFRHATCLSRLYESATPATSGSCLRTLEGHGTSFTSAVFSQNGLQVLTASSAEASLQKVFGVKVEAPLRP